VAAQAVAAFVNHVARGALRIRVTAARRALREMRIHRATLVGSGFAIDVRGKTLIEITAAANRLVHIRSLGGDAPRRLGTAGLQPFEQRAAAARDAGHHRADRHVENPCDFGVRQFFDIAQPDRLSERVGQCIQRRLEIRI
jgi:hypothetical protein